MERIRELVKKAVYDLFEIELEPELIPAPENIDADYSSNIPLRLASKLHDNPIEIAKKLSFEIEGSFVSKPGFLNFKIANAELNKEITAIVESEYEFLPLSSQFSGKTVICEFSDPNPFKVLHVGHLYTSVVGDAISRLFECAGAKVIRANFGGDVGLHVAKTLFALLLERSSASTDALLAHRTSSTARSVAPVSLNSISNNKAPRSTEELERSSASTDASRDASADVSTDALTDGANRLADLTIEDIARCYVKGTAAYEEDENAKLEITKLNKEIYKINAENIHEGELAELYWRGRELSYEYFRDFYARIGVEFDKYYPESTVAGLGLAKVQEELKAGVYEKSDGAVVFDGEKYGLHTRVFINREGVPTYETKDVGLIFQKYADYHFDKSVVITGSEQLEYMKVVLKSVEQYAPELVEKTTHLTHGLVKLPGNVKMASRKGNFLKAVDVLAMVSDELKKEYNSEDEKVAMAALKYAFLKYKMGGDIIFDAKESVKMTGNSGPYLLYSAVRAARITGSVRNIDGYEYNKYERNLAKKLLEYRSVLDIAINEMAPHKLVNYLYEAAQIFSRFYENCPVLGTKEEGERSKLVNVYFYMMQDGLSLLGIELPEGLKM